MLQIEVGIIENNKKNENLKIFMSKNGMEKMRNFSFEVWRVLRTKPCLT